MENIDTSYISDGTIVIAQNIIIMGLIAAVTFVLFAIIFKAMRIPKKIRYSLTSLITLCVTISAVFFYYLPAIKSYFS